ncbi:plasmid pRiA4b ORF-3 family protein [Verrucosispora sp. WMMA2044]|uniref:Plasmid pRiA4b ORF-3 family protein n=1 Tax=Verrucosispora sioxanthis TaxID=2499994 RepID=A0A6M1KW75_9ACTN|nr:MULTISPECIES: plasmid pRiA4b ORF-3 family protein [Micromonospora]NEE62532.1 plasmid pRiA4b ORF-3 family protein [Verrucosispora sioxanthis]NGM11642.1 plasmid pRiA4b ORF-3 family protein [Verrucosispora sioxanthis]WBB46894.1 plasmid pRiA4b ORF-3 family protein [Verrucosispora sp. WMMA2044]
MPRQIFQLRMSLSGVRPAIWRRVLVPGGYTLDRLHRVVQHAMGWRDCHLHSFEIDGVQYGEPDPDGELALHDELDVRLDAVVGKGSRFHYTYDFGDWWEHDLLVEDVFGAEAEERYPSCLGGERAGPPEDVGGPQGYRLLLAALAEPGHPEHRTMRDWVGAAFDPAFFDARRVDTLLRRLC